MATKKAAKKRQTKTDETPAPAAPASEVPAPAATDASEAQAAPVATPAETPAAPKAKQPASYRVKHGGLIVGRGELRSTGSRVAASELTSAEQERFLADGTLEKI